MVPSGPSEVNLRTPKQVQRRLKTTEIVELVAHYQAGTKVKDLAARYRINRNTVIGHINRAGVRRHYPALVSEEIMEAAQLYRSGWSLAAIGGHFGVNASTVRTALLRVGVAMRDCQGQER
jgi:DNA-directed RNA polymerase specialized sigma24 family protein